MKLPFSTSILPHITEANFNYYAFPFIHPERTIKEHDFIYLLQGEWSFFAGEERYHLSENSLLILPSGVRHGGISPCSPDTKTMYFHASSILPQEVDEPFYLDNFTMTIPEVKSCFSHIVSCKLSGNNRKANACFHLLLCDILEHQTHTSSSSTAEQIRHFIHSSPEIFYSNSRLAHMANVSVKTAETKFKSQYNKTIHQYILQYKMEEAVSYFKNFPHITVKEVAHNLGFYDEFHFSKQFRKIMNISPSEYKQSLFGTK